MKQYISIIGDSELQKRLEPLYELKSDIDNLKSEINKKVTAPSFIRFSKYAKFYIYQEVRCIG